MRVAMRETVELTVEGLRRDDLVGEELRGERDRKRVRQKDSERDCRTDCGGATEG